LPAGHEGTQLALPLELPAAPALEALGDWDAMIAHYARSALTTSIHPIERLRGELAGRGAVTSGDLGRIDHGAPVRVGGIVVARQRPGTASGIVLIVLEGEPR